MSHFASLHAGGPSPLSRGLFCCSAGLIPKKAPIRKDFGQKYLYKKLFICYNK